MFGKLYWASSCGGSLEKLDADDKWTVFLAAPLSAVLASAGLGWGLSQHQCHFADPRVSFLQNDPHPSGVRS